jgi:hypothetical protein
MVVPSDGEVIERLLRFDDCISARSIMSYDVRVYELVEHFLSGVPEKNTERAVPVSCFRSVRAPPGAGRWTRRASPPRWLCCFASC